LFIQKKSQSSQKKSLAAKSGMFINQKLLLPVIVAGDLVAFAHN
jgi:hypothetical protein